MGRVSAQRVAETGCVAGVTESDVDLPLVDDGRRGLSIRLSFKIEIRTGYLAVNAVAALIDTSSDGSLATAFTTEASNRGKTVAASFAVTADCSHGCGATADTTESSNTASITVYYIFLGLQLVVAFLLLCAYGLGVLWGCGPVPVTEVLGQTYCGTVFSLPEYHSTETREQLSTSSLHQAAMRCGYCTLLTHVSTSVACLQTSAAATSAFDWSSVMPCLQSCSGCSCECELDY